MRRRFARLVRDSFAKWPSSGGWSVSPMSFVDRIDPVRVEGEIIFDDQHCCEGSLIGPHSVGRTVSAEWNAEIATVALIGAVGGVLRAFQQRQGHVLAGHVEPPGNPPRAG